MHEDRRDDRNQSRKEFGEDAAAELDCDQAGRVDRRRGKDRGNGSQQKERMSEELGGGCQQRNDRRLVDVSPSRSQPADDKIEFVAEKAVVRISD